MILWRLPNILVVHLKRFEFKHALPRDKLDTFVDFPLEGLDMNRHCGNWESPGDGDKPFVDAGILAEYNLFGAINHYGRLGFCHYTAFARRWDETGRSSDFALFDDSSVRNVGSEPDVVVTPASYVLSIDDEPSTRHH
jgi:ubiquitin carboxyl-terminal hydrolase 4/11/15